MRRRFVYRLGGWLTALACVFALCPGHAAGPVGAPGSAQLKVSCKAAWSTTSHWSKDFRDAEGKPYAMSMAANEEVDISSDLILERRDGAWEIVDEKTVASASGAGTYQVSGRNPLNKTVSSALKDPTIERGYASLRTLDFDKGIATIAFTRPETTAHPECLECGFVALAATMDCLSSISTNISGDPPQECTVHFEPGMKAFTATGTTNWSHSGSCGMNAVRATCTLTYTPGEWEAVIVPPADFANWLPAATADPDKPGNSVTVQVQLRHRGDALPATDMTGTFYVTLENVSRQPGYCVNAPEKAKADTEPDLRLHEGDNLWVTDGGQGQSEEDGSELSVTIESHDFGSYGRLRVEIVANDGSVVRAHLEGDPGRDYLDLPRDDNGNHIADSWEQAEGVEELAATWDEANRPAGQAALGDGISLYEKYRGFVARGVHRRLDSWKRHLFVHDPTGWALMNATDPRGGGFVAALDCEVLFIGARQWTGPGSSKDGRRIVNFNSTEEVHAVDQHGLHLRFPFVDNPNVPPDYDDLHRAKHGTNSNETLNGTFGCTFPDFSDSERESPVAWLAIEVYASNIARFTRTIVQRHTWGVPELSDYWAPSTTEDRRLRMRERCADLADAYIRDHSAEWTRRNWLHFSKTLTHEVGHGIAVDDLAEPRNRGPMECVMRYFSEYDFPVDMNDRFELGRRKPWPSIYCRSGEATVGGVSCWHQIAITDRTDAPGAPKAAMSGLRSVPGPRRLNGPAPVGGTGTVVEEGPAVELDTELLWDDVMEGDPLRVEVTLALAGYQQALLKAAQTGSAVPATVLVPTVATNWHEHVVLTLYRHEGAGLKEVLAREAWKPFLRPESFSPHDLGVKPVAVSREWLVGPLSLNLVPGDYSLWVLWDGDGLVEPAALPGNGYVSAPIRHFTVKAAADARQRAVQKHRWAFHAYTQGAFSQAWEWSKAALAEPEARERLASEGTLLMAANAALKLQDPRGAASLLQSHESLQRGEPALMARELRRLLAPELAVVSPGTPGGPPRLALLVLPQQTYEVQSSADLVAWTAIDRRLAETNRYELSDSGASPGPQRFYRVVWLP